jgi:predicted metal-binding membrane protein
MVIAHWRLASRRGESVFSVPVFTGSYLAVWTATGLLAYLAYRLLLATVPAMSMRTVGLVAAGTLAVAGAYQLTPLKWACLKACRTPLQHFLSWRPGLRGALRTGVGHGVSCLGCCWALMLVLFVAGLMSLVWMGVLAAVIFVEKVLPFGARTAKPLGIALIALGAVVAAWPSVLL